MLSRLVPLAAFAVVVLSLVGCGPGKVNVSKTIDLETGDAKSIDLPAVSKPQTINVEFSSSDSDIYVYVMKEEDAKGEDGLLSPAKAKALATKNGKADNFTVEIPEKTAVRIIFRGADKKTSVTVKVTS